MKYHKAREELTYLENEADEREEEVCSKGRVKHGEMNGL